MERVTNHLAFATSPLSVTSRSSSFQVTCYRSIRDCVLPVRTKRFSRARVFALGSAPTPPPPPEDSEPEGQSEGTNEGGEAAGSEEKAPDGKNLEEVTADDILNSPSFLKKKLELVQKELITAKQKLDKEDEVLNAEKQRYVRLVADFENYRRRSVEDLRQQDVRSTAKVCKEILSVLDNFERATAAVNPTSDRERSIVSSYESINKQLLDALMKLRVEPVDAIGQPFDPEVHEAIQRLESSEYHEDIVCQQYSRGYRIGETLIRAAVVGVSVGPGPEEGASPGDSGNGEAVTAEGVGGAPSKAEEVGHQAADGL